MSRSVPKLNTKSRQDIFRDIMVVYNNLTDQEPGTDVEIPAWVGEEYITRKLAEAGIPFAIVDEDCTCVSIALTPGALGERELRR